MSDNKVDLDWFTDRALRTESPVKEVNVSPEALRNTLVGLIAFGEILDQIKKDVFYNRGIDEQKVLQQIVAIQGACAMLRSALTHQKRTLPVDARVFHGIVGKATESVELVQALHEHMFQNKPLDVVNVSEEMGDDAWYEAILTDALNIKWADTFTTVVKKLETRYPEKFTDVNANVRDLEKERDVLEGKQDSVEQPKPKVPRTMGDNR